MIQHATDDSRRAKRYLTVGEVADYLQLSMETVYMYARTGVVPATKIGKHWRFSLDRIEEWMSRQEGESGSANVSVLLVEPDLQIAEAFKTWFSEADCEVELVSVGHGIFLLLQQFCTDCAVRFLCHRWEAFVFWTAPSNEGFEVGAHIAPNL